MPRHKVGIGAVSLKERNGFSEHEQKRALTECKVAQFRLQEGCCILCTKPMNIRVAKWVSARGATSTLTEWAWVLKRKFNQDTLSTDLLHRSPEEIRAEYADGTRGHELACHGCASRFHCALYGEAGAGAAYRRVYAQVVKELGLTEEQKHDASTVAHVHKEVVERLAASREARLASAKGVVLVDDLPRPPSRKTRAARSKQSRTSTVDSAAQIGDLAWVRENKLALQAQDEAEHERLEQEERALLASYTNRVD